MSDTTRFCLGRGNSYGTRTCSCLVAFRLLLLIVLGLLQSSFAAHYNDDPGAARTTFNCTEEWCGEEWRENRLLKYKYEIIDKLVYVNNVTIKHNYDCAGARTAEDCVYRPIIRNVSTPQRIKTLNKTLESITPFNLLDLHPISTDNIVKDQIVNDTYPLNQDKIWQIRVPKGCRMVIYFYLFDIEPSYKCQKDNFTVQIEKKQKNIHRYCENLRMIEIRKTRVQLKFHSDYSIARRGIKAQICLSSDNKRTDDPFPCNCRGDRNRTKREQSMESSQSKSKSKSYRKLKLEKDIWTGEQLKYLSEKSPEEIDQIIEETEDENLRYLARLYKQSLTVL